jgi:hypothetical protein
VINDNASLQQAPEIERQTTNQSLVGKKRGRPPKIDGRETSSVNASGLKIAGSQKSVPNEIVEK